jgi:UDP-glucose:(heptosyl)LPS alpha-1,3-glucosyltransferase
MRFAFCIFKYFPYGGIQRDMMKISRECLRRGHQVKLFTLRWDAPPLSDSELAGLEVEVVPLAGINRHTQYDHFARSVQQAVADDRFDLVVGFNKMPGLDVYYGGDSCYIAKALSQRSSWYRLLPRFKSFHRAEAAVFGKHSSTEILMLSDVEQPLYRTHYQTQPERFHPLPPGIERDRIAPDDVSGIRRALRQEFNLPGDTLVVLFVGSGFIKKGLDRALSALAALPQELRRRTHMFVIGKDKGEAFERMAVRLGVASQVTFFTDGRDDIPRFMFAADALLHPAYDETAGMVIIEAMLAGLPAVVTRNCGYAKYLADNDAGIVLGTPYSQGALDGALMELLTSERREAWRRNGRAARDQAALFQLVPNAVDYLERFAQGSRPLLIFVLFKYFPYGGLQRDFMRIALAAQARGYEILVYCLEWQAEIPEGFRVIEVEAAGVANHSRYANFAEFVAEDAKWRQPAAVIGFNRLPGLHLYYAADSCFEHRARNMRASLYRRTERYKVMSEFERAVFGAQSDTHIMLIAESQRAQFQKYYHTDDARLSLLGPGVNRDRARPQNWRELRRRVRAEFGLGDDDLLLVLIGSGFITKGLDRVLHSVAGLPEDLAQRVHLLVIGQDNPRQFQRQARTLGVAERLTIHKGRDDIPAILQGADLMVHPAYMESGGMVLIEAVIAGLPVVASGACGFAHYIEDADAGVVLPEPFVQTDLDSAVSAALRDATERARWSANGVAFGRQHEELYNMPDQALKIIEDYLEQRRSVAGELAADDAEVGASQVVAGQSP